jgi:hypothetical protein
VQTTTPRIQHACLLAIVLSCGGGGGSNPGQSVVIPEVPPGAHETACQDLCMLRAGETICTAKHAEYCMARCRASTRDLPVACADCVLSASKAHPIEGVTIASNSYCTIGGPGDLSACATECDDKNAQPAPDLDTLCQLYCSFYVQEPKPRVCPEASSADCLSACRATIGAKGRVCAQCLIEQTIPGISCIGDDCQCLNSFNDGTASACMSLCTPTQ